MKAYRLANGMVLETEAEIKAYIRGLEMARSAGEEGAVNLMIEEAHVVKAAGQKSEADLAAEAEAAANPPADKEE